MSIPFGKQGLVELRGAGLTNYVIAPYDIQCSRISRIKNNFFYKGNLDGGICKFRIDTGSDVSILNERLIRGPKEYLEIKNSSLRYPTGETIQVKYKVNVLIELGKYKVEIPIIVANISDDCILGIDFLEKVKLEGIFESEFGSFERDNKNEFSCSRINNQEIPNFLESFFSENSKNLISSQKDIFANFLIEFQDVFSQDLITGNCEVLKHDIKLTDSKPIKQAPRRVQFTLERKLIELLKK